MCYVSRILQSRNYQRELEMGKPMNFQESFVAWHSKREKAEEKGKAKCASASTYEFVDNKLRKVYRRRRDKGKRRGRSSLPGPEYNAVEYTGIGANDQWGAAGADWTEALIPPPVATGADWEAVQAPVAAEWDAGVPQLKALPL